MSIYDVISQFALTAGLLSERFIPAELIDGVDEADVAYWQAIGEVISRDQRGISVDQLDRFHQLAARTSPDLRRHLLTWVVDNPPGTLYRISMLESHPELFNIPKPLWHLFYPPHDPSQAFEYALKFIEDIDDLTVDELRNLINGLPKVYLEAISQLFSGLYFLSLTSLDKDKMRDLSIEAKQKVIWNLIKLWATDIQENVYDADTDFFGQWIDKLVQQDVGHWPQNYAEAVILYASIRGMVDQSPEFLKWVEQNVPGLSVPERFHVRYPSCNADEVLGSAQTVIAAVVHRALDEKPEGFRLEDWVERMREVVALEISMGQPYNHAEALVGRRLPVIEALKTLGLTQDQVNQQAKQRVPGSRKKGFSPFFIAGLFSFAGISPSFNSDVMSSQVANVFPDLEHHQTLVDKTSRFYSQNRLHSLRSRARPRLAMRGK